MSATEILAELPNLTPTELQLIHQRVLELEEAHELESCTDLDQAIAEGFRSLETEPTVSLEEARQKIAQWAGRSY